MQSVAETGDVIFQKDRELLSKDGQSKVVIACEFCDKTFKFHAMLRQHEKVHYGIKQHECEVCLRRFLHKGTLKCHMRIHTGEKPYKCPHCTKTFTGQTALNYHIYCHTKEGTKCSQCSKVFATSSIAKQHLRHVHTKERPNVCNLCGATYKYLKSLKVHLRNHQKRVCPECGVEFGTVHAMMKHRKTHIEDTLPYHCKHCDRTFKQQTKLTSHENLRGRLFQCGICCHSFHKQTYLTNHERRSHWREMGLERLHVANPRNGWNRKGIPKPKRSLKQSATAGEIISVDSVTVDDSGKEIAHVINLYEHKSRSETMVTDHTGSYAEGYQEYSIKRNGPASIVNQLLNVASKKLGLKSQEDTHRLNICENTEVVKNNSTSKICVLGEYTEYTCSLCDALCNGASCFQRHICETTNKEKSRPEALICEVCGKRYASATTLAVHRSKEHRTKRFQCEQCHKSFGFLCLLQRHVRTVHENVRIACKLCDKKYKYSQDLKVHMRHHEDPKPFKCDQCSSTFRFPGALRSHQILHRKELPFKCDTCGKQFRFQNSLNIHKRLHLGIKEYKCGICERAFLTKAPLLRHMKVHEASRHIECTVCGAVFYKKVDLLIHETREHPNLGTKGKVHPIYACEHCGKEFMKKCNLKAHSYIHEEVYRFKCVLCSKSFKQHAGLRNHIINAHRKQTVDQPKPGVPALGESLTEIV